MVASVVLIGLMLGYGISVKAGILLLPLLVGEIALFSFAISLWFSVLNIRYRDVGTLLPVLIQLLMFISPVLYPSSLVPIRWHLFYSLNPTAGMLEAIRASLFGLPFDWTGLSISAVVTIVLFVYFVYFFCRREENLIDIL
jgi:lipopolysaccharide transport system permease protein